LNSRAFERLQRAVRAGPGRLLSSSECRTQRILDYFPKRTPAFVSNFLRLLQERILDRDCRPHASKHIQRAS